MYRISRMARYFVVGAGISATAFAATSAVKTYQTMSKKNQTHVKTGLVALGVFLSLQAAALIMRLPLSFNHQVAMAAISLVSAGVARFIYDRQIRHIEEPKVELTIKDKTTEDSLESEESVELHKTTPTESETATESEGGIAIPKAFLKWPRPKKDFVKKSFLPRSLEPEKATDKMWGNTRKAIEEHQKVGPSTAHATADEIVSSFKTASKPESLTLSVGSFEAQGPRSSMEDAQFYKEIPQGTITGIFDGHGGKETADYVCAQFQERFSAKLTAVNGRVHQAFEELIHEINQEVLEKFGKSGSTAIVSFIDKAGVVRTATIADSELKVYRKIGGQFKSIPISLVRNWSNYNEAMRASISMGFDKYEWLSRNPKHARYPYPMFAAGGLNVSRAFGDKEFIGTAEKPGIICHAEITEFQLLPGDVMVFGCDGLWDVAREEDVIEIILKAESDAKLAERLGDYALNTKGSRDNVTVVAVSVK